MDYVFGDGFSDPAHWNDSPDLALGGGTPDAVALDFTGNGLLDDAMWDSNGDGVADRAVLGYASEHPEYYADPDGSGTWSVFLGDEPVSIDVGVEADPGRPAAPPGADLGRTAEGPVADPGTAGLSALSGRWAELPDWAAPDLSVLPVAGALDGVTTPVPEGGPAAPEPPPTAESGAPDAGPDAALDPPYALDPDDGDPDAFQPRWEPEEVSPASAVPEVPRELTPEPPVQGGTSPGADGASGGVADDDGEGLGPPVREPDGSLTVATPEGPVELRDSTGDGYLDSTTPARE